jgi:hypothetical protein
MSNDTKLIMETWRKFINEGPQEADMLESEEDFAGFDDEYAPDAPDDEEGSVVYGSDEEGYDESGREFQARFGQFGDPEDPEPEGEQVPQDPDMLDV